jgi:hypothetical protein
VKVAAGLWGGAGMKPAQIVLHHLQHLLRGCQRILTVTIMPAAIIKGIIKGIIKSGEDIGVPCIQKMIGLSDLRGAAVCMTKCIGMGKPFLFRAGAQAKAEFWAQPLPRG